MSATISLPTNGTTITLTDRATGLDYVFRDLAQDDQIIIESTNPLSNRTNSANGGVTIQKREDSGVSTVTFRVLRFGSDDEYLNARAGSESVTVFDAVVKSAYFKDGQERKETFELEAGSITDMPTVTNNGNEQEVTLEYVMEFRNSSRTL